MSTFMAKKANVERKWYVLDAADKPLGRTAVIAADLLRGKLKPTYTPHVDCSDSIACDNIHSVIVHERISDEVDTGSDRVGDFRFEIERFELFIAQSSVV